MSIDPESLKQQIPYYLTAEDQKILVNELKAISAGEGASYFLSDYNNDFGSAMLQGDGWRGFKVCLLEKGELRSVRGLVLSNSCDVDLNNKRDLPSRVIFAPIVKLSIFEKILKDSGIDDGKITEKLSAIRSQRTTNIFYLPAGGPLKEDHLIRFDETHSMPLSLYNDSDEKEKLFTLSNTGFYMLILKLSVHFCRLQENINRGGRTEY